jgi:cysteinyl-tRNA synthetase
MWRTRSSSAPPSSGVEIDELTRTTTEWFHEDMAALGVDYRDDPGFKEPHATDYIPEMVAMIEP